MPLAGLVYLSLIMSGNAEQLAQKVGESLTILSHALAFPPYPINLYIWTNQIFFRCFYTGLMMIYDENKCFGVALTNFLNLILSEIRVLIVRTCHW